MSSAQSERLPFEPSGVVTLLTDFGLSDTYVGAMKGVLLARSKSLRSIVDLTHGVPPQDVGAAAFCLGSAWPYFPRGSVHVAVVDPGVGSGRGILAAEQDGHAFLAPDNGLLERTLAPRAIVRTLDAARFALADLSATFHGRDIFAPAAAALVEGVELETLGALKSDFAVIERPAAAADEADLVSGQIVSIDHFGNLISDVPGSRLGAELDRWHVELGGRRLPLVETYASAGAGALLALINSFGLVEVALCEGHAARALGLDRGTPLILRRRP